MFPSLAPVLRWPTPHTGIDPMLTTDWLCFSLAPLLRWPTPHTHTQTPESSKTHAVIDNGHRAC